MNINATLLAQAIVMIVFVAICWRYVYPPILSVMQEREKKISDGLEAAKKADDSLEEAQLAFNQELDKNKATDEAEKILTAASKTIENETNKAKEELKSQMSEIIIDTTQKILDQEISSEKHDDLLKKAAAEL